MNEPLIERTETSNGDIVFTLHNWQVATIREELMKAFILKRIMRELPSRTLLLLRDYLQDLIEGRGLC